MTCDCFYCERVKSQSVFVLSAAQCGRPPEDHQVHARQQEIQKGKLPCCVSFDMCL